jgi:hypothetical protein
VDGGALFVDASSTLAGSVNVGIGGGGFADFADVINANGAAVSVAFTGMGTLELDQQPAAPITVTGFGIGDVFDLTNIPPGNITFSPSEGSMTITENGTPVLTLEGEYSQASLTLEPDALGGTEVFFGNDVWTNTAGGDWSEGSNWDPNSFAEIGAVPGCLTDAVIGLSGTYTVTITDESNQAHSLAITNAAATLTGTGTLTVATTLDNAGIIDATGGDVLYVNADTLINEYSGVIAALNGGDLSITDQTDSANYGLIKAANGGSLTINHDGTATNYGVIQAVNDGTIVFNNNQSDANRGEMKAADGGSITINVALSEDISGGNFGKMEAVAGGTFSVVGDLFNAAGATIKAVGDGSQFKFLNADYEEDPTLVGNAGTILAADHGGVSFCGVGVGNQDGGAIVATDYGTVAFKFGTVENAADAVIAAEDHGAVTFEDVNSNGGLNNLGTVEALGWGSTVAIENSTVTNNGQGMVEALGWGAKVSIEDSSVTNGSLAADGGTLFIGDGSTLSNVAIVINHGGIAEFSDALDQGVTFSGDGTLELDQAPGEGAVVTNFAASGANDVLDFTNITWSTDRRLRGWRMSNTLPAT